MAILHRFQPSETKGRLVFAVADGYTAIRSDGSTVCPPQPNRGTAVAMAIADYRREQSGEALQQAEEAERVAQKMMGSLPESDPGCCDDETEILPE